MSRRCDGASDGTRCDDAMVRAATVHCRTNRRTLARCTIGRTLAPSHTRTSHVVAAALLIVLAAPMAAQQPTGRRGAAPKPASAAKPAPRLAPLPDPQLAPYACPSILGEGVQTKRVFCDVLTGRDLAEGIIIPIPRHTGPAILTFDLHNRHTYSEELVKTNRAYRHYTATIGVLTMNNDLLTRSVVQNEFRTAADLVDRVSGGAGPGGVKAVAPTGSEPITIMIPEDQDSVSILGEKLAVIRADGTDNFSAPGRPIAIISNVMLQFRPGPLPRTAPARRPAARR